MKARFGWAIGLGVILLSGQPALAVKHVAKKPVVSVAKSQAAKDLARQQAAQAAKLQEAQLEEAAARAAAMEAEKLALASVAAAQHLQSLDLHDANRRKEATDQALAARSRDLEKLMPVMLRLSRYPAETLLAAPEPPDRALLGLLAARGVAAQIAADARALEDARAHAIQDAQAVMHHEKLLNHALERQKGAAVALDQQLQRVRGEQQGDQQAMQQAQAEAARAAAEAESLKRAIAAMEQAERAEQAKAEAEEKLAAKRKEGEAQAAAKARVAMLTRPAGPGLGTHAAGISLVAGRVVKKFGAPGDDGPASGLSLAAAPGAVVVSPCAGRVGFAGPFRSYGKMVIIECGRGDDFVLAGFDRLDAAAGHALRPGEPLGRMGEYDPSGGKQEILYVELRRNGNPVDPQPYLGVPAR